MQHSHPIRRAVFLAPLACALILPTQAALLLNGGFESGLADWTSADQIGSEGGFMVQTGTLSPLNGFDVPAPFEGTTAAMTDAFGPGSHVLYQDFVVPAMVVSASLEFSLFINNGAEDFFDPDTLDFATPELNQQVRVDLMVAALDPFSLDAGDILMILYESNPGDDLVSGYDSFMTDVTALFQARAGETLRLRFAEVDNVNFLNLGVDAVSFNVVIPEPSASLLLTGALGLAAGLRRRRSGG